MLKKSILDDIEKYVVFYGYDSEQALMDYELLILEPKAHSQKSLCILKDVGKVLIAYISVIEISKDDECFSELGNDCLISINGDLAVNPEYQTYYMDITQEKVKNILLRRASAYLKSGYDGIFIDTIGNLDYFNSPYIDKDELYNSAAVFLSEVKMLFPSCVIIQNNGFLGLSDYTAKYIDAICFENPPLSTIGNLLWTYSAIKRLNMVAKEHNLKVLLLEEDIYNKSSIKNFFVRRIAKKNGWLYYKGAKYYNHI